MIPSERLTPGEPHQIFVEHARVDTSREEDVVGLVTYAATTFLDIRVEGEAAGCGVPFADAEDGRRTDRPSRTMRADRRQEVLSWSKEESPRWDADKKRIVGSMPKGVFDVRYAELAEGDVVPGEWWRVEDDGAVVGFGWLDIVWGDAEILLATAA